MSGRARTAILFFAIVGLGFAGASTYVHHRLLTDPTYTSFCDVNETFNCTQVYLSRFGTVAGVPVAVGGLIWFALVGLVAGGRAGKPDDPSDPTPAYLFALATVGLAAILYLGYASFFLLKTYCLLCMGTYVCVVGIFIVSGAATSMPMSQVPGRLLGELRTLPQRPVALLITVLYLAGAVTALAFFPKTVAAAGGGVRSASVASMPGNAPGPMAAASRQEADFLHQWDAAPRMNTGVPADGAKVVVIKFVDYQCPICKEAYGSWQPLLDREAREHPGAIKSVTLDFPLNTACNTAIHASLHPAACEAAAAVRIADDHGKRDEMIAWLFQNQETLTPAAVKYGVARLLNVSDFDAQYQAKLADIRKDVAIGAALNVSQTPTIFINGVCLVPGYIQSQFVEMAINHELAKAGAR